MARKRPRPLGVPEEDAPGALIARLRRVPPPIVSRGAVEEHGLWRACEAAIRALPEQQAAEASIRRLPPRSRPEWHIALINARAGNLLPRTLLANAERIGATSHV